MNQHIALTTMIVYQSRCVYIFIQHKPVTQTKQMHQLLKLL